MGTRGEGNMKCEWRLPQLSAGKKKKRKKLVQVFIVLECKTLLEQWTYFFQICTIHMMTEKKNMNYIMENYRLSSRK